MPPVMRKRSPVMRNASSSSTSPSGGKATPSSPSTPSESISRRFAALPAAGVDEERLPCSWANAAGLLVERRRELLHVRGRVERRVEVVHRHHGRHASRGHLTHEVQLRRLVERQQLLGTAARGPR